MSLLEQPEQACTFSLYLLFCLPLKNLYLFSPTPHPNTLVEMLLSKQQITTKPSKELNQGLLLCARLEGHFVLSTPHPFLQLVGEH